MIETERQEKEVPIHLLDTTMDQESIQEKRKNIALLTKSKPEKNQDFLIYLFFYKRVQANLRTCHFPPTTNSK